MPNLAQTGNWIQNIAQVRGKVLYRAVIPSGTRLTDSKTMENAVRGIYHGTDGIKGHANLVAQKGLVVTNTLAATIGVASLVIGQYYMKQISCELEKINESLSKISDFQDNEFRSRVFSLFVNVEKISNFQVEILENNDLRLSKINQLNQLESENTHLLGQANLTLTDYTYKKNIDYPTYEKNLNDIQKWNTYQKILIEILYKIPEFKYALHFGQVSRNECVALLPIYTKQVKDTQEKLVE